MYHSTFHASVSTFQRFFNWIFWNTSGNLYWKNNSSNVDAAVIHLWWLFLKLENSVQVDLMRQDFKNIFTSNMIIEVFISPFMMNGKLNHFVVASDITTIIYNWYDKSRKCKYEPWADPGILVRGGGRGLCFQRHGVLGSL